MANGSAPERKIAPVILIRGFGFLGVSDDQRVAYQGFNDGTVYPHKRGENYIYEGLILRFMKSRWKFQDATNVIGYYSQEMEATIDPLPEPIHKLNKKNFYGDRIVIDPGMAKSLLSNGVDPRATLWVFRFYDLGERTFSVYSKALKRLITLIRDLCAIKDNGNPPKVNIIAHSMGGLIVQQTVLREYGDEADKHINKIVTLGTPHQGISFHLAPKLWGFGAAEEMNHFRRDPQKDKDKDKAPAHVEFTKKFPMERVLTIVGTNYHTYSLQSTSLLNQAFPWQGEFGANYNRSDGLVKQASAQLPGAPRTFVHKCHGGNDSLVTSREAFEVAKRFMFGDVRVRLHLINAKITRGHDWFGKSEFFFGVSIKPRGVDFELFHQSDKAENCYGPFHKDDLSDPKPSFNWVNDDAKRRCIWEGWLDTREVAAGRTGMVFRLDFYVGERDLLGLGFSDNIVFRKHYYVKAALDGDQKSTMLWLYDNEHFDDPNAGAPMATTQTGWKFEVAGTGFKGVCGIEIDRVPEVGAPTPIKP